MYRFKEENRMDEKDGVEKINKLKITPKSILLLASLGVVGYFGGSYIGNKAASPNDDLSYENISSASTSESSASTSESSEDPEVWETPVVWEIKEGLTPFGLPVAKDGTPTVPFDASVDIKEEPWNNGNVPSDDSLTYLTVDELTDKLETGERFIVYFGRHTCPWCHLYRPTQDNVLKDMGETIYAVDTEYYKGNEEIASIRHELGVNYVPTVAVIEDGKLVTEMPEDIMFIEDEESVKEWFEENL